MQLVRSHFFLLTYSLDRKLDQVYDAIDVALLREKHQNSKFPTISCTRCLRYSHQVQQKSWKGMGKVHATPAKTGWQF